MTVLPEVLQGNRLESLEDVFYQIRLTLALVHDFAVACGERGEDGVLDPYTWCTVETMTGDARGCRPGGNSWFRPSCSTSRFPV